ncbi:nuclear pore complex protein NUP155-like [Zingiber officinale]|uniref:nuclear pore complex protein NUP155-like n=1 Tax=Zingiber officinale TaxID=94328 RepID=UPI001C4C458A|nr:nuclear pore complex protein NUP155-like [Zingiber officinale]
MAWGDETVGLDVASAGLHISERIGRDVAGRLDLEEAIEASRYASHPYSTLPKEWPSIVEVADTRELPLALIERYNASGGEGTAICGIFPEIRRAWASVDDSLFLWRFDKWDGQCPEYSADEQVICAVSLARTRPGIFVEAIQYLLVLATPVELILIGVCCMASGDGSDPFAEISLQPLPEYRIPSDGVTMTCITCTDKGRIFLGGRDGHIYEMQYSTGSGWRKRCRKVCLTTSFGSLLSRWILPNDFKFGAADPIVDMVIDNERHILYTRTEAMKLQAFDLGGDGQGLVSKIAEGKNFIDSRETQHGARRSTGSRAVARGGKPTIVCIAPLSTIESKRLHMIAILSDGRRLYLSTSSGGNSSSIGGSSQRPSSLKVIATRPSPPIGVGGGLNYGTTPTSGRVQPEDMTLKVEAAFYSAGTLVLSDSSASNMSSLLIVNQDSSGQQSASNNFGMNSRNNRALRELVSSLPIEGRMLFAADILPLPDIALTVQSLFSDAEAFAGLCESSETASGKLWARGDLPTQHILPRRRAVVFSATGLMELVFNRPVDILRRLFESNVPRSHIEEFFNRFGSGEAAAMCLMLAADLVFTEGNLLSSTVSEKAAEAFEDPGLVGMPQFDGTTGLTSARSTSGGFSMGQVVQEAEPLFSGAHEGLCLCSSRLLFPLWELPVMVVRGKVGPDGRYEEGVILCRLSVDAMKILEIKIHSLEQFLRSRRNKRRGLYGYVAGIGDYSGSILYGERNWFGAQTRNADSGNVSATSKRQRLSYTPAELAAMEVRAMECLRRLLRRSREALFLLQILCQHNVARLVQGLDNNARQKLIQLTFNQMVCSEEGEQLANRLITSLMEYYIGPDGKGTVDEISENLKEGCPSYYKESNYHYFLAVEYLEKASVTMNALEKESLARDAFKLLIKCPESADLAHLVTICKRFADLRFYEAAVRLPLQKAQAFDSKADMVNLNGDSGHLVDKLVLREQCYEIVMDSLRSLTGRNGNSKEFNSSQVASGPSLDQATRDNYIRQIIQLCVQWPDTAFHEHLYRTLIDLGLENELLEYGGSDLVPFLQSAGHKLIQDVQAVNAVRSASPSVGDPRAPSQAKYYNLLARYYSLKRQHLLAAHVLYKLAEMGSESAESPTLAQRLLYLSNAIIQAKTANSTISSVHSSTDATDDGLLDLLEAKHAVLRFQIKIKEQLEPIVSMLENTPGSSEIAPDDPSPWSNLIVNENIAESAKERVKELSQELKSISQLYNEFAIPFKLWEICLEMLNFSNYSGDADSKIVRETWARLLDQALSRGGVAEACSSVKRVGSNIYTGEEGRLPLEIICLHLEMAASERVTSGVEFVGDEDIARALLTACKDEPKPVLSAYDQLLSNGAILPSPNLKLRLLRSVLVVLREWVRSVFAITLGTTAAGAASILGGALSLQQKAIINQGARDKITSLANRYMTEVRCLPLPQNLIEPVYKGFRDLEQVLFSNDFQQHFR